MRKIGLILIALVTFVNVNGQKLPSKKEQYNFLKWYANYKNLIPSDTSFKFKSSFSSLHIENIPLVLKMSNAEKQYLIRQVNLNKTNVDLDLTTIVSQPGKSSDNYINYCSLPVFTPNKKIAVIMWGIYCGEQCGKESIDVFEKTKTNKWKLLKVVVPVSVF